MSVCWWPQVLWISILRRVAQQRVYPAIFLRHRPVSMIHERCLCVSGCPSPELCLSRGSVRGQRAQENTGKSWSIIWERTKEPFWGNCFRRAPIYRWMVRNRRKLEKATIPHKRNRPHCRGSMMTVQMYMNNSRITEPILKLFCESRFQPYLLKQELNL